MAPQSSKIRGELFQILGAKFQDYRIAAGRVAKNARFFSSHLINKVHNPAAKAVISNNALF